MRRRDDGHTEVAGTLREIPLNRFQVGTFKFDAFGSNEVEDILAPGDPDMLAWIAAALPHTDFLLPNDEQVLGFTGAATKRPSESARMVRSTRSRRQYSATSTRRENTINVAHFRSNFWSVDPRYRELTVDGKTESDDEFKARLRPHAWDRIHLAWPER